LVVPINGDHLTGPHAISLRGAWRLGGALLLVAAAPTVAAALVQGSAGADAYLIAACGAITGLAALTLPWQWIDERWLVVVPAFAVVEIAVAVATVDYVLNCLYFTVALYVALIFPPRAVIPFVGGIIVALLLPFAYDEQPAKETAIWLLVVGPAVVFIAAATCLLTGRLHTSRETYRQLSSVDGLTGVGNYRALIERLEHETQRHLRRGREFALLTLDLDNFKQVNDMHGHLVGDAVLTTVGSMIDVQVRAEDGIFRQGGDEFAVVAPETSEREGLLLASRIERALDELTSGGLRLSASVGCAVYPHDGTEPGELLEAADTALRERKSARTGRAPGPLRRPVGIVGDGGRGHLPS
jgi:diguanylate cyclase (GGDEF)-like protein